MDLLTIGWMNLPDPQEGEGAGSWRYWHFSPWTHPVGILWKIHAILAFCSAVIAFPFPLALPFGTSSIQTTERWQQAHWWVCRAAISLASWTSIFQLVAHWCPLFLQASVPATYSKDDQSHGVATEHRFSWFHQWSFPTCELASTDETTTHPSCAETANLPGHTIQNAKDTTWKFLQMLGTVTIKPYLQDRLRSKQRTTSAINVKMPGNNVQQVSAPGSWEGFQFECILQSTPWSWTATQAHFTTFWNFSCQPTI